MKSMIISLLLILGAFIVGGILTKESYVWLPMLVIGLLLFTHSIVFWATAQDE